MIDATRKWQNLNAQFAHYTRNRIMKRLKLIILKFVRYLNASGTVTSSVVRIIIALANCVLRRIFETEKEKQNVACWQQIVLGRLDKGWDGEGWVGMGRDGAGREGKEVGYCEIFHEKFRWRIRREGNIKVCLSLVRSNEELLEWKK